MNIIIAGQGKVGQIFGVEQFFQIHIKTSGKESVISAAGAARTER